jgi:hypothetical protein
MAKPCPHTEYNNACWVCYHAIDCSNKTSRMYRKAWQLPEPDCQSPNYVQPPLPSVAHHTKSPTSTADSVTSCGPGTELTKLFAALKFKTSPVCSCEAKAKQMNTWGVEGCRQHRAEIVEWLRNNARRQGWARKVKAAALATIKGIAIQLNPTDLYGSLVDLAIKKAEEPSSNDKTVAR